MLNWLEQFNLPYLKYFAYTTLKHHSSIDFPPWLPCTVVFPLYYNIPDLTAKIPASSPMLSLGADSMSWPGGP